MNDQTTITVEPVAEPAPVEDLSAKLQTALDEATSRLVTALLERDDAIKARDAALADRAAAILERDQRELDEAFRQQRVDVERMRFKVKAMTKNLATVEGAHRDRADAAIAVAEAAAAEAKKFAEDTQEKTRVVREKAAALLSFMDKVSLSPRDLLVEVRKGLKGVVDG